MNKKRTIEIIDELLQVVDMGAAEFARSIGVTSQNIYDIQNPNKKNSITNNFAGKVASVYPHINKYYLLTGEGSIDMLNAKEGISNARLELMMDRLSRSVDVIASTLQQNAEANLIRARAEEKTANTYAKHTDILEKLVDHLIDKNKLPT